MSDILKYLAALMAGLVLSSFVNAADKDAAAQPTKIALRDVTAKQFIQTVFAAAMRRSIVVSPMINARDEKFSVDVLLPTHQMCTFSVEFLSSIGVSVEERNGVDYFDKQQVKADASATGSRAGDKTDATDAAAARSLRDLSRVSAECWVSWMERPRYALSCLDGDVFYDTDFVDQKPVVNWSLREVDLGGQRYRNRTPAAFYARGSREGRQPAFVPTSVSSIGGESQRLDPVRASASSVAPTQ
jgi:hypothetical protein